MRYTSTPLSSGFGPMDRRSPFSLRRSPLGLSSSRYTLGGRPRKGLLVAHAQGLPPEWHEARNHYLDTVVGGSGNEG